MLHTLRATYATLCYATLRATLCATLRAMLCAMLRATPRATLHYATLHYATCGCAPSLCYICCDLMSCRKQSVVPFKELMPSEHRFIVSFYEISRIDAVRTPFHCAIL